MFELKRSQEGTARPATALAAGSPARDALRGQSYAQQCQMLSPKSQGYAAQSASLSPARQEEPGFWSAAAQRFESAVTTVQEAASGMVDEVAGWADFAVTAIEYTQFDGMIDRVQNVSRVMGELQAGADISALGLDPNDHRLRNVAEMQTVIQARGGKVGEGDERLAAQGLRDANLVFYVLMGNNAGRFDGMNMERYRQIGHLGVKEAAQVLPQFEAELFAGQSDKATIEFGDSLSAKHRKDLFELYNFGRDTVDAGDRALDHVADTGQKAATWLKEALGVE